MNHLEDLERLYDTVQKEVSKVNEKLANSGGNLTGSDVSYINELTHTLKSLKTTIAMMEAEDGESGRYMPHPGYGNSYNYGGSYRRGRDSMGRYTSRRGYSYDDGMMDELRTLMESAPDERTKAEFRQFISKLEKM